MSDQTGASLTSPVINLPLTGAELRIVESAVRSFLSDFGHDEADLVGQTRAVLDKIAAARSNPGGEPQAAG
jgi:hypothetical protein